MSGITESSGLPFFVNNFLRWDLASKISEKGFKFIE
jgi:hypothetical protein